MGTIDDAHCQFTCQFQGQEIHLKIMILTGSLEYPCKFWDFGPLFVKKLSEIPDSSDRKSREINIDRVMAQIAWPLFDGIECVSNHHKLDGQER